MKRFRRPRATVYERLLLVVHDGQPWLVGATGAVLFSSRDEFAAFARSVGLEGGRLEAVRGWPAVLALLRGLRARGVSLVAIDPRVDSGTHGLEIHGAPIDAFIVAVSSAIAFAERTRPGLN